MKHLPTTGLRENESEQQFRMMAIRYTFLKLPMPENAGRPGEVHNYAADEDISATLTVETRPSMLKSTVNGTVSGKHLLADRPPVETRGRFVKQ